MPKNKPFKPRVILPEMKPLPYDLLRKRENQEALELIRKLKKRSYLLLIKSNKRRLPETNGASFYLVCYI